MLIICLHIFNVNLMEILFFANEQQLDSGVAFFKNRIT